MDLSIGLGRKAAESRKHDQQAREAKQLANYSIHMRHTGALQGCGIPYAVCDRYSPQASEYLLRTGPRAYPDVFCSTLRSTMCSFGERMLCIYQWS